MDQIVTLANQIRNGMGVNFVELSETQKAVMNMRELIQNHQHPGNRYKMTIWEDAIAEHKRTYTKMRGVIMSIESDIQQLKAAVKENLHQQLVESEYSFVYARANGYTGEEFDLDILHPLGNGNIEGMELQLNGQKELSNTLHSYLEAAVREFNTLF